MRLIAMRRQAVTLVFAVLIMLVVSVLGWTIAGLVSTDMDISVQLASSENALYLAEAGRNWAAQQFLGNASWRCSGAPQNNLPHQLGGGEYDVVCADSATTPGAVEIVSTGYIPSQSACAFDGSRCRGKRVVGVTLGGASLKKLIQAGNYFDWSGYTNPSQFNGIISVVGSSNVTTEFMGYEGDGDANHNEATNEGLSDYNPRGDYGPYQPVYSGSLSPAPTRTFMSLGNYPTIDMTWFQSQASHTWPSPLDRDIQMPWAMMRVGRSGGVVYRYAQSFQLTGTNNQRTPRSIRTLLGPTIGGASYPLGNSSGSEYDCSQSFVAPSGTDNQRRIASVSILLGGTVGSPTGKVTVKIVKDASGTPSQLPADVVASAQSRRVLRSFSWNTVTIRTAALTAGERYWVVWDAPNQSTNNYYTLRVGDYAAGGICQAINGSWQTPVTSDTAFTIRFRIGSLASAVLQNRLKVTIYEDASGKPGSPVAPLLEAIYISPAVSSWTPSVDFSNNNTDLSSATNYWLVWEALDIPAGTDDYYYSLRVNHYAVGSPEQGSICWNNGSGWQKYPSDASPSLEPDIVFDLDRRSGSNIQGDGEYIYASEPGFFTGMAGEAIKNYSKAGDWSTAEWAVINSVASVNGLGTDTRAILNNAVIYNSNADDWYDIDDSALIKRFTGANTANQNWYIAAGLVFDATAGAVAQTNKSFVAEQDIGLVPQGSTNSITLQMNPAAPRALVATLDGDIYSTRPSTSGSDTVTAQRRTIQGMVYTQNGDATFEYLWAANGATFVGRNLYFNRYIQADYNETVVSGDGFFAASNVTWSEQ